MSIENKQQQNNQCKLVKLSWQESEEKGEKKEEKTNTGKWKEGNMKDKE